jgi:hypothetical protein
MNNLELLCKVREKLSAPGSWTQGAFARDRYGHDVPPDSPYATSWCLEGAAVAVGASAYRLHKALNVFSVAWWNDGPQRTHEEVLTMLNRAIWKLCLHTAVGRLPRGWLYPSQAPTIHPTLEEVRQELERVAALAPARLEEAALDG